MPSNLRRSIIFSEEERQRLQIHPGTPAARTVSGDKVVGESKLRPVEVVDNEVVNLAESGGEDMIEPCEHLATGQGVRV